MLVPGSLDLIIVPQATEKRGVEMQRGNTKTKDSRLLDCLCGRLTFKIVPASTQYLLLCVLVQLTRAPSMFFSKCWQ